MANLNEYLILAKLLEMEEEREIYQLFVGWRLIFAMSA